MYPVSRVFDWDDWQDGFDNYWSGVEHEPIRKEFRRFKREVLENFKNYDVPVIALGSSTSKEAVCVVFEKVNTGGKPLDAFELVTAMYAAEGHELRRDWYGKGAELGRQHRLAVTGRFGDEATGILSEVSNTDFLHAVSLFHTRERRREARQRASCCERQPASAAESAAACLLEIPGTGGGRLRPSGKVSVLLHVYRVFDLPYQTQIIPLAAILADIGDAWEHEANRAKLVQWYWNGVFGELYGSAVESRIARDFMEVPAWLKGAASPPPFVMQHSEPSV